MRQIEEMLPEAIDLFTRAMRAGHNIHSGLQVLADETVEPLGGEFKKVVEDLTLGSAVDEALHNLGDRVPVLDLRFFSTGVILQRETGANIVTVMENLSAVIRERLQLRVRLRITICAHGKVHCGYASKNCRSRQPALRHCSAATYGIHCSVRLTVQSSARAGSAKKNWS